MRSPPTVMLPPVGESSPPIRFSSVVLPEPDGPISAMKSPFDVEVDIVQHLDLLRAARVGLAEIVDLDQCVMTSPVMPVATRLNVASARAVPSAAGGGRVDRTRAIGKAAGGARTTRAPADMPVTDAQVAECLSRRRPGVRARLVAVDHEDDAAVAGADERAAGTSTPFGGGARGGAGARSRGSETRTPMSGTMRGSFWSSATRTLTVALLRSAVGMMAITCAGIFQSG